MSYVKDRHKTRSQPRALREERKEEADAEQSSTPGTEPMIDATPSDRYSGEEPKENPVAVKSIQLGQVWRQDSNGQDYLVTKVYNEVFTQYAVLRPAEVTAPDAPTVKVKVTKGGTGVSLPGFTFTQEGSF